MTEALQGEPNNPGSISEFAQTFGYEPSDPLVLREHGTALSNFRQELANRRGISLEDLHSGVRDIGNLASVQELSSEPIDSVTSTT